MKTAVFRADPLQVLTFVREVQDAGRVRPPIHRLAKPVLTALGRFAWVVELPDVYEDAEALAATALGRGSSDGSPTDNAGPPHPAVAAVFAAPEENLGPEAARFGDGVRTVAGGERVALAIEPGPILAVRARSAAAPHPLPALLERFALRANAGLRLARIHAGRSRLEIAAFLPAVGFRDDASARAAVRAAVDAVAAAAAALPHPSHLGDPAFVPVLELAAAGGSGRIPVIGERVT